MTLDELRQLATVLRELGVHSYKCGDVELQLGPAVAVVAAATKREPARPEMDPTLQKQLQRLPAAYRDPTFWNHGQ